jgi:hypothetical protein
MITILELAAEALGSFLTAHMSRRFGSRHANLTESIPSAARLALEHIGNSDALYHNVEHTMLVALVGYDIMRGRSLGQGADLLEKRWWDDRPDGVSFVSYSASSSLRTAAI